MLRFVILLSYNATLINELSKFHTRGGVKGRQGDEHSQYKRGLIESHLLI